MCFVAFLALTALAVLQVPARATSVSLPVERPTGSVPDYMRYIVVNDYKFDPLAQMPDIPASLRYDQASSNQPTYYIVQFKGPVTDSMKKGLESSGVKILYYISYNAFIVRADSAALTSASRLPTVRWTGIFQPAFKLSPTLSTSYDALLQRSRDTGLNGAPTADAVTAVGISPTVVGKSIDSSSGHAFASVGAGGLTATSPSGGPITALGAGNGLLSPQIDTSQRITIQLVVFEKSGLTATAQFIAAIGGTGVRVSPGFFSTVSADVPRSILTPLVRAPTVMWIERATQPYVFNDLARWVVQSGDTVNFATPVHDQGIHGTGQTVTLGDTGLDYRHPAFWDPGNATPGPGARKVTDYYSPPCSSCDSSDNGINHGTHTSGSVGGDDGVWHQYDGDASGSNGSAGPHDGQAFDAFIQMQDLSNDGFGIYFDSVTDLWTLARDHGSWIHSNSWGSCCNQYIQESADTDLFIWNNQDFLVVFAAGNSGSGLNSLNPFADTKNVIGVGATMNGLSLENVADFSSRGPAADGRIKPDVMAPGVAVWSAQGQDPGGDGTGYWQLSGTSMATPTTAGASTLVRQYYMDGWYPTGSMQPGNGLTPSAALIKATVINSAREMTGSGAYANGQTFYPNDNQGFGRVTLDDALFFQGQARGLLIDDHRTGINTGDVVNYGLAIGDSAQSVEITLVWSDYPGTAGCGVCLVNDLDLVVTAPDGTVYVGNQYIGYNPGESQPNPTGSDHLNNVESVLVITSVQAGLWTVSISGFNVPQGPQTYALVMTGGIATEHGIIQMNANRYQSSAIVGVQVVDTGLNLDPGTPDTVDVNMSSTTETTPEVLTLTETGPATSVFGGSIPLQNAAPTPDGVLQVADGDTITAMYFDNNDGLGGSGPTFDYAVVDDTPPIISGVAAINLRFNRATIVWTTDEPSNSVVTYGTSTPPGTVVSDSRMVTSHTIGLSGLTENTTYFFSVASTDAAGNTALDDNAGAFYTFMTPVRPPTAPPEVEWPTFHNNIPRQGISPSNFAPPIDQQWTDGPFLINRWNGPVMADGILFSAPLDGVLRARDPYSGAVLWQRQLGGQYYYTSTMTANAGVLYATFYGPSGGFVYALDEFTGATIWVVGLSDTSLDFNARIPMAYADGLVFGSTWAGQAYALNAVDGTVAWTFQLDAVTIASGATINAGIVYFSTVGGTVYALDEFSGTLIWSLTLDNTVTSTPLYAQGNIYDGTYSGTMYALDALTGAVVWSAGGYSLIDTSTPAYDGAALYFATFDSRYVSLDATDGTQLWATSVGGPIGSSPVYANGFVYGISWDGNLYTFDAFGGAVVDQDFLSGSGSTSFPAVSDGWVWVEDNDGTIHGFLGQLPVGLLVTPGTQARDTVPNSVVDYTVTVKNVGISGPDTFDASVTLGALGWAVDLFEADGITPLPDTDGDTIPDTGSLATGASVDVTIRVTVPGTVNPGDSELSLVTFTSSNDLTRAKTAKVVTTVPPPGVTVGPRAYFTPNPGDTITATMQVGNTGGFADTIDITAVSDQGWTVRLYEADGTTPLPDTNGNTIPDVGLVPGLMSATIVIQVDVPTIAPPDTIQRTAVTGTSNLDPTASGTGTIVIELTAPPNVDWPTFHNNQKRAGASPSPHVPPITEQWRSGPNTLQLWTGPVVADGILFSTTIDGAIRARDPFSGTILWERTLGDTYYYTGTPAVANGVVYATFYGGTGGAVYALDEMTGATIWRVDQAATGLDVNARVAMAYANGMVFGAAWGNFINGQAYALDATNGAVLWSANGVGLPFGGPAIGANQVYIGTTSSHVMAMDETTGAIVWDVAVDNFVSSPPLYAQGNVFVGTYSGTMYALDALSGAVVWSTGGFSLIDFSTPAYDGAALYFGDFNNEYVALDVASGAVLWRTGISGPVGSSVAIANGFVYGTAWDGQLRTLDAATGAIVDDEPLGSFASTSMPAISRGWIWVEDFDGRIYGFGGVGAGVVQSVAVVPATIDVVVTSAVLLRGQGYDAFGNPVPVSAFTWASLAGLGTVLTITPSGDKVVYIAGASTGVDTLQATAAGFTGSATINVLPGALDHVSVSPSTIPYVSVVAGATRQFTADSQDRFGNSIPGRTFTWGTTGGIGAISSSGLFTASTAVGAGTVTATDGAKTGLAIVQVVPGPLASIDVSPTAPTGAAGAATWLSATGRDANGNAVTGATIVWSAAAGSILPLNSDGTLALFTAPAASGPVDVTASSGGHSTTVTVDVGPGPLAAISSGSNSVAAGATLTLGAADLYGNAITSAITWSTGGGSITAAGVLTAPNAAGSVTVTAQQGGRSVTRTFLVTPAALDHVQPSTVSLNTGDATTLTAYDQFGNVVPGATWTTTVGSVSASPEGGTAAFSAGETGGSGTVTVTAGGVSKTVSVTVNEVALPSIVRQVSQPTSLLLLVLVIILGALTAWLFVKNRSMSRDLQDTKEGRGGRGGGSGGGE